MATTEKKVREPLFHIVKRAAMPWWKAWLVRVIAVLAALVVCGVITVLLTGHNPLGVYQTMFEGTLGTKRRIWKYLQETGMLLCVSLAVTPAFKMRFWNIGAEGQVLVGGLATAICMMFLGDTLPPVYLFPTMILASMAASAVWAMIPAFFKAFWNTNETLFTLMMNYIAMQLVAYCSSIWAVPKGSGTIGVINAQTNAGWLPTLFTAQNAPGMADIPVLNWFFNQRYLLNLIIVVALTAVMYIYLKHSKQGYEIAVVGESENTARYVGINVKKVILRTMLVSGAICGIAGFLLVSGQDHSITSDTVAGRGFTAIMVSWLAKFNPLFMVLTSLLLVFLQQGAGEISTKYTLNQSFSEILTGIIIFFIIGSEFFINYQVKFRSLRKKGEEVAV